jgi:heat shock protein HslJ
MACLERPKNDFETRFMQALASATLAVVGQGGRLVLSGPAGRIVLVSAEPPEG